MKKSEIDAKLQQVKKSDPLSQDFKALIQNNVSVEVNLSELGGLAKIDPNLAREYLQTIKENHAHIRQMDEELIALEKKEQAHRFASEPKDRAYNTRGQIFGLIVMLFALAVVGFAIYKHETGFAVTVVIAVALLSLYHISGQKEQRAITWHKDQAPRQN